MRKRKVVSFTLSGEAIEMLQDLALAFGINKSVILERMIKYVYENNLEEELFIVKRRKKEKNNNQAKDKMTVKPQKEDKGFKIKL